MKKWKDNVIAAAVKKAMPILSFPCVQLMGTTVMQLISDSRLQAEGMKIISGRADSLAAVGYMDLAVEAEAFGCEIRKADNEVPTVLRGIIRNRNDVDRLNIPDAAGGRTGLYIKSIEQAAKEITGRPVFGVVNGPISLAGRLTDMSEIKNKCHDDPQMVFKILEKITEFILSYISGLKKAGANGVIIAEQTAGMLPPEMAETFSSRYVKKLVDNLKDDNFSFIYHNCGPNTPLMLKQLANIGADAYHFGDAVKMTQILKNMPSDVLVMGNISPSSQFRNGTPESVYAVTTELLKECSKYSNFVISSGCDIPPLSPWANIDSFFKAVQDWYGG